MKPLNLAVIATACVWLTAFASGCAQLGPTPEQAKAMEGSNATLCIKSPGWNGSPIEVHYSSFGGKSVGTAGGGGKATCGASSVEFQNEGRAGPNPRP